MKIYFRYLSYFIPWIFAIAILSGCSFNHDYVWEEYPISPERVVIAETDKDSTNTGSIEIKSGDNDTKKILLGHINMNAHYWYGSLQLLADSIVTQLSGELIKRNYTLGANSKKTVEVKVDSYSLEPGMWRYAYNIDFEITLGNGIVRKFHVKNSSPASPVRGINGAVALAVIEIMNSRDFIDYIN